MTTETTIQKRRIEGIVTSIKEDKTIHIEVQTRKTNKKYRKQYWESKKYAVHDEKNEAAIGDRVVCEACRPMSKTKKWRLVEIKK